MNQSQSLMRLFLPQGVALNYNDIWGMRGVPVAVPLPHVSGSDVAGDLIAVGEDVQNFKVGDRVFLIQT